MTDADGYVYQYRPDHPRATKDNSFIPLHQLVVEEVIGRLLDTKREHVHHIDGNPSNNDPSNLQIVDPGVHVRFHRGWKLIGTDWHKPCGACGRFLKVEGNFHKNGPNSSRHKQQGICVDCNKRSCANRKKAVRQHTAKPGRLTKRIEEIARLWASGDSIPEIAKKLGKKTGSVKTDIHGNLRHRFPNLFPYRRNEFRWAETQEAA